MKRIVILIIISLVMLPITFANLRVDDIRGFVNDERISNIDKDGGDFDARPNEIIDLVVSLENKGNQTIQAKLKGTIENIDRGDDIVKEQDFYDIEKDARRSKTLSFSIPSDARNDVYDFDLIIYFKYSNGTEGIVDEVRYDVIVQKLIDEKSEIDINEVLFNLTTSCNSIIESTNTCFGYIEKNNNCVNELSTVKEERGTFKQHSEDCTSSLNSIKSEKTEVNNQKILLEDQIGNMLTQEHCNNRTTFAITTLKRENDDKFNQTLMMIGGVALAYWWWQKRKKEKASVLSSYESDYYSK